MNCFHCGEDCKSSPVYFDDKAFCCEGCKTVYRLLSGNKLYKYYEFESHPGIKMEDTTGGKFDALENKEIADAFITFSEGDISKVTFHIPSIHCSSCIWLLENLQKLNAGILFSKVDFPSKKVSITYNNKQLELKQIALLLDSISYTPSLNTGQESDKTTAISYSRRLVLRLGVAGFCFGNIMLLSFPEYFNIENTGGFALFFVWINFFLSLPVIAYSSLEFFRPAFKSLLHKQINIDLPISIGIITLFLRSSYELFFLEGAGFFDSLAGLVFFLLIGRWYQSKTYKALTFEKDFASFLPLGVLRKSSEGEKFVPIKDLQENDIIIIRNNEVIPADGILLSDNANVDYSFITGESAPIHKAKNDIIHAGGKQMGGQVSIKLTKKVSQSYLSELWQSTSGSKSESAYQSIIDRVSKYFTIAILLIAAITALFWWRTDVNKIWSSFTAVLIVACPCALALSAPFGFGTAMRILGKKGFYLKNQSVIETLTNAMNLVFDKTGTLTYANKFNVSYVGEKLTLVQETAIKSLLRNSIHPLSQSVANSIAPESKSEIMGFEEYPGKGVSGKIGNEHYKIGSKLWTNAPELSDAGTKVHININDKYVGAYVLKNFYREGIATVLKNLQKHYRLFLLSGDNDSERQTLQSMFPNKEEIYFNKSPEGKQSFIKDLRKTKGKTVMFGDGLNDFAAFKESDAGIAIVDSFYNFSPASDAILWGNSLNKLDRFLAYIRKSKRVVIASFVISFLYNIVGLYYATQGLLTPLFAAILMPISSVTVVAFSTFATLWTGRRM